MQQLPYERCAQTLADILDAAISTGTLAALVLESSPWYERGRKYLPAGQSAIVAFGIKGGRDAGPTFVDNVELFSHLANIGDSKSLIIHPASTTHAQLTAEEQQATGVTGDLVHLSVGLETLDDLFEDLERGFAAVRKNELLSAARP